MSRTILALFCVALLVAPGFSAHITANQVAKTNDKNVGLNLCPLCVNFLGQSINELLNIILNAGVVGGCGELCSLLPNKVEATVCTLLCDYVGIKEFISIVEKADLDPIYGCELLHTCPIHDGGAAKFINVTVNPPSGPQGTTFEFIMTFDVLNQTGTGEIDFSVIPPADMPFGTGFLNEGFAPGQYAEGIKLQAEPSEEESFSPGQYKVEVALCYGECGSSHPHSQVLDTFTAYFTITE